MRGENKISTLLSISIEDPFPSPFSSVSSSLPISVWETDEAADIENSSPQRVTSAAAVPSPFNDRVLKTKGYKLKPEDRQTINAHLGDLKDQWIEKDKKSDRGLCIVERCRFSQREAGGHCYCIFHGCEAMIALETSERCPNQREAFSKHCTAHHNYAVPAPLLYPMPTLRRVQSEPPAPRIVEYQLLANSIPLRGASFQGITQSEKDRRETARFDNRHAITETRPPFDKHIKVDVEALKQSYLCREVTKYLRKRDGFDGTSVENKRVIVRGGFHRQEGKIIMAQPVSPLKLFLAQAERGKALVE